MLDVEYITRGIIMFNLLACPEVLVLTITFTLHKSGVHVMVSSVEVFRFIQRTGHGHGRRFMLHESLQMTIIYLYSEFSILELTPSFPESRS